MRIREEAYRHWAQSQLPSRSHEEQLSDGITIDVQVRLSRLGATQMFIGMYSDNGTALLEEYYPTRPGETTTRAMVWGVNRARAMSLDAAAQPQRLRA